MCLIAPGNCRQVYDVASQEWNSPCYKTYKKEYICGWTTGKASKCVHLYLMVF